MSIDVRKLAARHTALKNARAPYETAWRDLAEHFLPTRYRQEDDSGQRQPEVLNRNIVDSTGIRDMSVLAAGMQGGMTSPVRPWFNLALEDEEAAATPEAGAWLDEVTERMRGLFHRSNFYNIAHALYGDLGTFGQGLLIETADWSGLRFTLAPCGTYVLDTNEHNEVDTFFRTVRLTARQIMAQFGREKAPEHVRRAADEPGMDTLFHVTQAVFPRTDRMFGRLDAANMPYASIWFMDGGRGGQASLLRESGFEEFPAFAPRWDVTSNDVYGRSPAMNILPDCRMLQAMGATTLKGTHKAVDPPYAVPANLKSAGVKIYPGAVNYLSTESMQAGGIQPLQQVNPQTLAVAENKIQAVQQAVHDGLYADLFKQLMLDDRRQITATEIEAREREKLTLLGPVVERLDREFLSPLVLRTYALMARYDYLPEPPESIAGSSLRVEFVSVMAQAQKLISTSPIDQTVAFVATLAQGAPDALDNLDTDALLRLYAKNLGAPASILRSEEDVSALRKQRADAQAAAAEQQQTAAGVQQAVDLSGAAKNLGQTPVGADGMNAMDALLGGLGGM